MSLVDKCLSCPHQTFGPLPRTSRRARLEEEAAEAEITLLAELVEVRKEKAELEDRAQCAETDRDFARHQLDELRAACAPFIRKKSNLTDAMELNSIADVLEERNYYSSAGYLRQTAEVIERLRTILAGGEK
jgi:hypothetical protein